MKRAVAWDIDGTLVDSEELHHRALMAVSARYGVTIAAGDDRFIGVGMDEVWSMLRPRHRPRITRSEWQAAITAAYLAGSGALQAFPGALAAMATLRRAGVRQCCVSNSARVIVDGNLATTGALAFMDFAISRDDIARGKPDPAPYREACRRLRLLPRDVLAVEDSEPGMNSARAAGCAVVRFNAAAGYERIIASALAWASRGSDGAAAAELAQRTSVGPGPVRRAAIPPAGDEGARDCRIDQ